MSGKMCATALVVAFALVTMGVTPLRASAQATSAEEDEQLELTIVVDDPAPATAKTEPAAVAEPRVETAGQRETVSRHEPEPEPERRPRPEAESERQPESQPHVETSPEPNPRPQPEPALHPDPETATATEGDAAGTLSVTADAPRTGPAPAARSTSQTSNTAPPPANPAADCDSPPTGAPTWCPPVDFTEPPAIPGGYWLFPDLQRPVETPTTLDFVGPTRVDPGVDQGSGDLRQAYREVARATGQLMPFSPWSGDGGPRAFIPEPDCLDGGGPDGDCTTHTWTAHENDHVAETLVNAIFTAVCNVASFGGTAFSPTEFDNQCGRLEINGTTYDTSVARRDATSGSSGSSSDNSSDNAIVQPPMLPLEIVSETTLDMGTSSPFAAMRILRADISSVVPDLRTAVNVQRVTRDGSPLLPSRGNNVSLMTGNPFGIVESPFVRHSTLVLYQGLQPLGPATSTWRYNGANPLAPSATYGPAAPVDITPGATFAHLTVAFPLTNAVSNAAESLSVIGGPQDVDLGSIVESPDPDSPPRIMDLGGFLPGGPHDYSYTITNDFESIMTQGLDWEFAAHNVFAGVGACIEGNCNVRHTTTGDHVDITIGAGNIGWTGVANPHYRLTLPPGVGIDLAGLPGARAVGNTVLIPVPDGTLVGGASKLLKLPATITAGWDGSAPITVDIVYGPALADESPAATISLHWYADEPPDPPEAGSPPETDPPQQDPTTPAPGTRHEVPPTPSAATTRTRVPIAATRAFAVPDAEEQRVTGVRAWRGSAPSEATEELVAGDVTPAGGIPGGVLGAAIGVFLILFLVVFLLLAAFARREDDEIEDARPEANDDPDLDDFIRI